MWPLHTLTTAHTDGASVGLTKQAFGNKMISLPLFVGVVMTWISSEIHRGARMNQTIAYYGVGQRYCLYFHLKHLAWVIDYIQGRCFKQVRLIQAETRGYSSYFF